jgi:hypothetical protein
VRDGPYEILKLDDGSLVGAWIVGRPRQCPHLPTPDAPIFLEGVPRECLLSEKGRQQALEISIRNQGKLYPHISLDGCLECDREEAAKAEQDVCNRD